MLGVYTRNLLFRRFFQTYRPLRLSNIPKFLNTPKLFLIPSCALFPKKEKMDNFDLHLKSACEKGEAAITQFMNSLQDSILEISKAYKDCLYKQIEIIDEAVKGGALSPKWDDLPKYRILASDLKEQLNSFVTNIKTLGTIARNETLSYITQQQQQFKLIAKKTKELEKLIEKQMDEIKELENKVLVKNRESIKKAL